MRNSSASLPFWKATACGNDFLMVFTQDVPPSCDRVQLTIQMCDRRNGIGADGVEWLSSSSQADVAAEVMNADGSKAEISGNGTRCVACFWHAQHGGSAIRIQTGAGTKICKLISHSGSQYGFEMEMGWPENLRSLSLKIDGRKVDGLQLSLGNPHFVTFAKELPRDWQRIGAEIQRQSVFPHSTNVEFVRVLAKNTIESSFFERGAGETRSSGTGSCASAVAAIHQGACISPVEVRAAGGAQTVRWEQSVFLTGPATLICAGAFFI